MSNARILIVDDHIANLKLAAEVLRWAGYETDLAVDAEAALERIRQAPPDLILMDIALPGTDGLTLTRMLKAGEATKGIRIIALTAFAMKGDEQKAFDAGCDAYITKPIDTRQLARQVGECLDRETRPP